MSDHTESTEHVLFKPSSIHGMGGFARHALVQGQQVIEYVGERIDKNESLKRCIDGNPYIFSLDDELDLDGNVAWNPARYINHCCQPNCEAELIDGHIWLMALRDIPEGEELTFDYGYDLENYEDHPCDCGAPGCVGFIVAEEYRESVRKKIANRAGKSRK